LHHDFETVETLVQQVPDGLISLANNLASDGGGSFTRFVFSDCT
jgi:hypothetical protein